MPGERQLGKADIRTPEDSKYYPMTVLWVEGRADHRVARGDIIALLDTPKGEVKVSSPLDGRVGSAHLPRGTRLPAAALLLSMSTEDEIPAPPQASSDRTPPPAPAAGKPPRHRKTKERTTFIEKLLVLSLLLVSGIGVYSYLDRQFGPYTGPMSKENMAARQTGQEAPMRLVTPGSLSAGQGLLVVYSHDKPNRYTACEAIVVGPNTAAFDSGCLEGSRFDNLEPGQRPTGWFHYNREMDGHVSADAYPVTELNYWEHEDGVRMLVAMALMDPAGAESVADRTGRSGWEFLGSDENSSPFVVADRVADIQKTVMQSAEGCRYWAVKAPEIDSDGEIRSLQVNLSHCEVGDAGALKFAGENGHLFAGFYFLARPPEGEPDPDAAVAHGALFGSGDLDHIKAARDGRTLEGARKINFSGKPLPQDRTLLLRNACDHAVTFNMYSPDNETFTRFEMEAGGNSYTWADGLSTDFLFSIDEGDSRNPGAESVEWVGVEYFMQPASVSRGQVLIPACPPERLEID